MMSCLSQLRSAPQLLIEIALTNRHPPWLQFTGRETARFLDVSVQVLANWRVRDQGPPYSHASRGKGNKCLYRLSDVIEWLTGRPAWLFDRDWLVRHGLAPIDADQDYVDWAKTALRSEGGLI